MLCHSFLFVCLYAQKCSSLHRRPLPDYMQMQRLMERGFRIRPTLEENKRRSGGLAAGRVSDPDAPVAAL